MPPQVWVLMYSQQDARCRRLKSGCRTWIKSLTGHFWEDQSEKNNQPLHDESSFFLFQDTHNVQKWWNILVVQNPAHKPTQRTHWLSGGKDSNHGDKKTVAVTYPEASNCAYSSLFLAECDKHLKKNTHTPRSQRWLKKQICGEEEVHWAGHRFPTRINAPESDWTAVSWVALWVTFCPTLRRRSLWFPLCLWVCSRRFYGGRFWRVGLFVCMVCSSPWQDVSDRLWMKQCDRA